MSKGNSGHFEGTKGEKFYRLERRNQEQSDNKDESSSVEPNEGMDYNKAGSSDVRKVDKINKIDTTDNKDKLGIKGEPNSVTKNYKHGRMIQERHYDENGDVYLDIDYTDHGNPKFHPIVPHQHNWYRDENGKPRRKEYIKIKKRKNNNND